MSNAGQSICLVTAGGKQVAYDDEENATSAINQVIFGADKKWLEKLGPDEQAIVVQLRSRPELAVQAYNKFVKQPDRWKLQTLEIMSKGAPAPVPAERKRKAADVELEPPKA